MMTEEKEYPLNSQQYQRQKRLQWNGRTSIPKELTEPPALALSLLHCFFLLFFFFHSFFFSFSCHRIMSYLPCIFQQFRRLVVEDIYLYVSLRVLLCSYKSTHYLMLEARNAFLVPRGELQETRKTNAAKAQITLLRLGKNTK